MSVGPASGTGGGGGNQNINDPENPYIEPGPSYVAPPPPPPPPPDPPPEATGHEQSFDSIVAEQLAVDYPSEYSDGGGGTPLPDLPAAPQDTAPEAPAPDPVTAADYFALGGNPATPDVPPGGLGATPDVQNMGVGFENYEPSGYLSADSQQAYFADPQHFQDEVTGVVTQAIGPPPTLGDSTDSASQIGSDWFKSSDSQQQQIAWWESEYQKALQAGDSVISDGNGTGLTGTDYAQQLLGELDRVNAAFDQVGTDYENWVHRAEQITPGIVSSLSADWQARADAAAQVPTHYSSQYPVGETTYSTPIVQDMWAHSETDIARQKALATDALLRSQNLERAQVEQLRDTTYTKELGYWADQGRQYVNKFGQPRRDPTERLPIVDPLTGTHYDASGRPIAPTIGPKGSFRSDVAGALGAAIDFFGTSPIPLPFGLTGGATPEQAAPALTAPFTNRTDIPGLPGMPSLAGVASTIGTSRIVTRPAQLTSAAATTFERPLFGAAGNVVRAITDLGDNPNLAGRDLIAAAGSLLTGVRDVLGLHTASWNVTDPHAMLTAMQQDPVQAQAYLDEHPFIAVGNQLVLDPWNLAGPHLLFEFSAVGAKAGEFEHLAVLSRASYKGKQIVAGRTLKDLVTAGRFEDGLLTDWANLDPTWRDVFHVRWAENSLYSRYDARVPDAIRNAGYVEEFTKRVTMRSAVRLGGEPAATRAEAFQRVMDEEAARIIDRARAEQGTQVAVQLEKVLWDTMPHDAYDNATLDAMVGAATARDQAARDQAVRRAQARIRPMTGRAADDNAAIVAMLGASSARPREAGLVSGSGYSLLGESPVTILAKPEDLRYGARRAPAALTAGREALALSEGRPLTSLSGITADALAVAPNGDIVPYSTVAGPIKRIVARGAEEAKLVRGLDGKIVTRAEYEADTAITKLQTTPPPEPPAARVVSQPVPKPDAAVTQAPLLTPPSIPMPVGAEQPIADESNAVRTMTKLMDQGATLDGSRLGSDVTQHQLDLLHYFTQRDGTDHIAQLMAQVPGQIGYQQASDLIQELDKIGADGRITASVKQMTFLLANGATSEDLARVAKMTRNDASRFIDQFLGHAVTPEVDTSGFTKIADFTAAQKTMPAIDGMNEREVSLAWRRGQKYGKDFLGEMLGPWTRGGPMLPRRLWFNLKYIDPSPAQMRTLRGLQRLADQGNRGLDFLRGLDLTKLKADQAIEHLKRALGDPIALMMQGEADAPTDLASAGDIRDLTRASDMAQAKQSSADYLAEFLPKVSESPTQPGFPRTAAAEGFGTMRGEGARAVSSKGVPLAPPAAFQELFLRNLDQHAGTLFDAPMRDAIGAPLFAKVTGEPSLTSADISFNRAMDALADTARKNPNAAETERFTTMVRNFYHSDGAVAAAEQTAKDAARAGRTQQTADEITRNVTLYRQQLPAQQEELRRLTAARATALPSSTSYQRLTQRIDFLTDQIGRISTYLGTHDDVTTRTYSKGVQAVNDALEKRYAAYRSTFKDLPATPPVDAPLAEAAPAASDLDMVDAGARGHLRVREDASPFTQIPPEELPQPAPIDPRWAPMERQRSAGRVESFLKLSPQERVTLHAQLRGNPNVKKSAFYDVDKAQFEKDLPSVHGDFELLTDYGIVATDEEPVPADVAAAFQRIYGGDPVNTKTVRETHNALAGTAWDDHFVATKAKPEPDDLVYSKDGKPVTYGDLRNERKAIMQDAARKMENTPWGSKRGLGKTNDTDWLTQTQQKRIAVIDNHMQAIEARYGGAGQVPDDLLAQKFDEAYPRNPAGTTHDGQPVLTDPGRRFAAPLDPRLVPAQPAAEAVTSERGRVVNEIHSTLSDLGVPDRHIAATQGLVDSFARAAAENNPQHYKSPEDLFRRINVMRGPDGLTFEVAGSGHELVYPGQERVPYGGSFVGRANGGGIIQLFSGQRPVDTFRAFLHEFGHLAMTVLTEEQLTDLARLVGARDGNFTPAHLEGFAQSMAAWAGTDAAALKADLIAQNPAAQSVFRLWRNILGDAWQSVRQYFGKNDIDRQLARFWDETFKGNSGMYASGTYTSRSARAMISPQAVGRQLRRPINVVDPLRTAGRYMREQFDEFGPAFDAWAERFYNNDALLNDQRRMMFGGKVINPLAAQKMTQVMQVGDMTSSALHSFIDGGIGNLIKGVDAQGHIEVNYEDLRNVVKTFRDNDFDRLIKIPGYEHFGSSKAMQQTARVIKTHADEVLAQWESLIPHQSVGDLIPLGVFPQPVNGRYTDKQMQVVHDIINGLHKPVGWNSMAPEVKQALADFNTSYRDLWNKEIAGRYLKNGQWQTVDPTLYDELRIRKSALDQAHADNDLLKRKAEDYKINTDPGLTKRPRTPAETAEMNRLQVEARRAGRDVGTFKRAHDAAQAEVKAGNGLHILDSLDKHIFIHDPNQWIDLPKFADHLGSAFGQAHAKSIGFEPGDIPLGMRSALWVKGQLTPLWMTLMPQYHINNLAGNWMAQVVGALRSDMHTGVVPRRNSRVVEQERRLGSEWTVHPYRRAELAHGSINPGRYNQLAAIERGAPTRALPSLIDYASGGFRDTKGLREYLATGPTRLTQDELRTRALRGPKLVEAGTPTKRGAVTFSGDVANAVEDQFKDSIFTQSMGWHFTHRYTAELRDLETAGTITREQRTTLAGLMGIDEMRAASATMGLDEAATNKVLAAGRASVANANLSAYNETRSMLRDYRYRNKIDGFLDRFLPVHYWSTKNFAFMTRSAIDRPALAIGAAKAYNAWQEQNAHLPMSLRTGYAAIPFDHPALSWIPGVTNKTWHMRLTNLTNPVLFAVPRIVGRWDWHGEDQSIWQRVAHMAADGGKNFWEASGYRVGPTYDMATMVGDFFRTTGGDLITKYTGQKIPDDRFFRGMSALLDGADFLTSPGLDRNLNITEGFRPGVIQAALPLGGLETLPMRSQLAQHLGEFLNKEVYGSAYTINETNQIGLMIASDEMNHKITHPEAQALATALWENNFDAPGLRTYIDNFWGGRSNQYLMARGLAVSGKTYTDTWRQQYQGLQQYYDMAKTQGKTYQPWELLSTFQPATRWLIGQYSSGAIGDKEFNAAVKAAQEGGPNLLLQRAWQQTQGMDAQVAADMTVWHKIGTDLATWKDKAQSAGYAAANTWAYGWYNNVTGQTEDAHAPWIGTYQLTSKHDRAAALDSINRADGRAINDAAYSMMDDYYATRSAAANAAAPYWAKIDAIRGTTDDRKQRAIELGHDETQADGSVVRVPNMILWDQAVTASKQATQAVYDQAKAAGIPMVSGSLPRHGQDFYALMGSKSAAIQVPGENQQVFLRTGPRATDYRHTLITANDALPAVDQYETAQAQKNWLLNQMKQQYAPSLWLDDGTPNPDYKVMDKDGQNWSFNMDAYQRDRETAAQLAQTKSFELVRSLRQNDVTVGVPGVTAADFMAYTDERDKAEANFKKTRQAEIDAAFALPQGTDDAGNFDQGRADARNKAFADLKVKYGDSVLDKDYRNTASADVIYNQGGKAIQAYYYSLTPAQKTWFQSQYGSAFHEEPGPDGSTRHSFDPKALSTDQVNQIVAQQGLDIFGDQNVRSEVATGQISPYTMNKVADQAAQQAMSDHVYALQESYYNGAGLTADQQNNNKEWLTFLDTNSVLEQQASDLRGPAGDFQNSWEDTYKAAVAQGGAGSALAQYIAARIDTSKRLDTSGNYDAQTAWWHTLDPEDRKLLMREAPATFGKYSTEPSDQVYDVVKQYQDGAGLTPDQKTAVAAWEQFKLDNSSYERAANDLRGTGTPNEMSWGDAEALARSQNKNQLADYIAGRIQQSAALDVNGTYDARTVWWHSLDPAVRAAALAESPDTFSDFAHEPSDAAFALIHEYDQGAGLSDEQHQHKAAWEAYLLANQPNEQAANNLRGTGTPEQRSWKATIKLAQSQGMYGLADYITARQQQFADLAMGETYDAQRAWWGTLTDEQRTTLLTEAPDTFSWLGDPETGGTGATSSTGGGGGSTTSSGGGGGSSGGKAPKTTAARASTGSSAVKKSSGGSSGGSAARTSSGGTGAGTGGAVSVTTSTATLVRGLDPFFASGEDDGRGEYAQKVSDWIDGQIFANFQPGPSGGPLDFIFGFLRQQMLHFAGTYLGAQPTAWDWQQLWNRLTQGTKYLRQPAPPMPVDVASPTPVPDAAAVPTAALEPEGQVVTPTPEPPPAPVSASDAGNPQVGGFRRE